MLTYRLYVVCARNWSRKAKEISENRYNSSYLGGRVDPEGAGADLHIAIISTDCTPLFELDVLRPGMEENQENSRDHHSSTYVASGVNVES
jgi:hypothetical protein